MNFIHIRYEAVNLLSSKCTIVVGSLSNHRASHRSFPTAKEHEKLILTHQALAAGLQYSRYVYVLARSLHAPQQLLHLSSRSSGDCYTFVSE